MKKLCKIFAFCTFTAIGLLFNSCSDDYTNTLYTIEMKRVNGGTSSFDISSTEITQELYTAVMGKNRSWHYLHPEPGENQNKRPVDSVSFYDALVFCNKLSIMEGLEPVYSIKGSKNTAAWGEIPDKQTDSDWESVVADPNANGFRLPSKAEWDDAIGVAPSNNDDYGWSSSNSNNKTHEVAKKAPNSYGLYDMFGNVWELGFDIKSSGKRVRLGGCYSAGGVSDDWDIPSNDRYNDTGFRVVKKAD